MRHACLSQCSTSDRLPGRLWRFDIAVTDGFVLTEFASVVDTLRTTNRVVAQPVFDWTFRSAGGGMITSSSEAVVSTKAFPEKPEADYLFVIGNSNPDEPGLTLGNIINAYTHRGTKVFLLAEAASRYIKDKGDKARGMSTHWENSALLRERMEDLEADNALASGDGPVVTCAGMSATLDVVLAVIGRHIASAELRTVADIFLHEKIRDFDTRQPYGGARATATGDADLDRAIALMQSHIEEPVPIGELVRRTGVSARSLERKFKTFLATTPNGYYRQLRLARANNLLLNTTLSIRDVGLASGFGGGFSVLYKKIYGITPLEMRRSRRTAGRPAQTAKSGGRLADMEHLLSGIPDSLS